MQPLLGHNTLCSLPNTAWQLHTSVCLWRKQHNACCADLLMCFHLQACQKSCQASPRPAETEADSTEGVPCFLLLHEPVCAAVQYLDCHREGVFCTATGKISSRQCNAVRYSTVHSTVQYSTLQYSTVQYSTVQYSTVQYSTVQYSTVQYAYWNDSYHFVRSFDSIVWWHGFQCTGVIQPMCNGQIMASN